MSWPRILLCGIAAAAAVSVFQTLLADTSSGTEQAQLTIGRLQAKLAELEQRVKALEDHKLSFSPIVPAAGEFPSDSKRAVPRPFDPGSGRVPPTWKSREINGLRFYTIPLGASAPKESTQSR